MINRKIEQKIVDWINNSNKALLIDGARQVGKTTTILKVLNEQKCDYAKFNLIENNDLKNFLQNKNNLTKEDFYEAISVSTTHKLIKGKTIIFIDEIQECRDLFTLIKFLVEEGSYKYIISGSVLGIELSRAKSVPVGYLEKEKMFPLDFEEFALAFGIKQETISTLHKAFEQHKPVPDIMHDKMMSLFHKYLIVGGMPDAVQNFITNHDYAEVHKIHKNIVDLYKDDFSKYQNDDKKLKLVATYNLIPAEINNQNKRYKFSDLNKAFRFDRYLATFEWLNTAEVSIPVYNVDELNVPLLANEKSRLFKLFINDVGLLNSMYGIATIKKMLCETTVINYGAIYENYVAQELHAHGYPGYYYKSKKFGEVDFVIEYDNNILPIEVKSGKAYTRHSALDSIMSSKTYDIKYAFVFTNENISETTMSTMTWKEKYFDIREKYKLVYLPIYMTIFIDINKIDI